MFSKSQKIIIIPVFVLVIAALVVLTVLRRSRAKSVIADFVPPLHEDNAIAGEPKDIPDNAAYGNINISDVFSVSMCAFPSLHGNEIDLYYTNKSAADISTRFIVFDTDGNIIYESGLLNPGEYLKSVALLTVPEDKKAKIKMLSFYPETWESAGSAEATVTFGS